MIVKDFSRFGQDYIELGDYLERIFPFLGVRFISVNDGYDSNDYKGTTGGCTKEFMREDVLNGIVWESVKGLLAAAGDARKKIGRKQAAAERNNADTVKKLADLQKKKAKCEAERFTNMDQFMAGNLDKEVYQKRRGELTREAERLDGLISDLEAKLQEMEVVRDDGTKALLETVERFSGAAELDQKIVDALVEKVLVYDPGHVEIRWKFSDEVIGLMKD